MARLLLFSTLPCGLPYVFFIKQLTLLLTSSLGFISRVLPSLPASLKFITLFEEFNEDYNNRLHFDFLLRRPIAEVRPELIRTPSKLLSAAIAEKSLSLEELYASYMVDAKDFFEACKPGWSWNSLTSVALTSQLLTLDRPKHWDAIKVMLVNAATAALRMPQLRALDIWNGRRRLACAFQYRLTADSATIGWCGTWNLELDPDVVDAWRKVANRYSRHALSVLPSRALEKESIMSHAAAIRDLRLQEVIHPISLQQILIESERWFCK